MRTYRRYVTAYNDEDRKNKFQDQVLFIDKEIPNVPHYIINIVVLKYEPTMIPKDHVHPYLNA
jgi:hypothetical protein